MSDPNQYGLPRDIPASVRREVRQRCGFGCVMCGAPFFQYDHLDPPFAEATAHNASGIVALCGGCHDRKTKGLLSVESVKAASAAPAAKKAGATTKGPLDIGSRWPIVEVGEFACRRVQDVIRIDGVPIFSVAPPEADDGPFRLSALLADDVGKELLRIESNALVVGAENWDVHIEGAVVTVRNGPGDIALVIRMCPPDRLVVERMSMTCRGASIEVWKGRPSRIVLAGGRAFTFERVSVEGGPFGAQLSRNGISFGYGPESNVWFGDFRAEPSP